MLSRIFGKGKKDPKRLSYEAAREVLENQDQKRMREMAKSAETKPEMLYYLAGNGAPDIRSSVARNPATPIQADALLAEDAADEVRQELARKIARLVPDLAEDARGALREAAIVILEKLAADQLPKVRAIIAEEIKYSDRVPKHIVEKLARDMETIVAAPILEYSPLLGDDDLKELIAAGVIDDRLAAIARRKNLSAEVSEAVAATLDIPAVTALLANKSAQIREDTLDKIIDNAKQIGDWHEPLAMRTELSMRAVKRIAGFVASALIATMVERNVLDDDTAEEVLDRARKRIADETADDADASALNAEAEQMHERGLITDDFIRDAIKHNKRGLILHCLAVASGLDYPAVKQIMMSKSGRMVTALVWKTGLSMRSAFNIQRSIALVPPGQLLPAKNGIDYPLEPADLEWQLEAFID